jgi:hypothetical protein
MRPPHHQLHQLHQLLLPVGHPQLIEQQDQRVNFHEQKQLRKYLCHAP